MFLRPAIGRAGNVSDNDRVLGGVVSIHDGKGWRRFSPEDVPVRFKGEMDLEWKRVMNSSDKTVWEPFINNLIEQTRPNGKGGNYEAEKVLAAVLWKYSNATYDYQNLPLEQERGEARAQESDHAADALSPP